MGRDHLLREAANEPAPLHSLISVRTTAADGSGEPRYAGQLLGLLSWNFAADGRSKVGALRT